MASSQRKSKELLKEEQQLDRRISHVQFGMFGNEEVERLAEFEVTSDRGYEQPGRTPVSNGVLDRRLGISDKHNSCETCGMRMQDCPGHFGYIRLELPVLHIGYLKQTVAVLQCICKTCSRILLPPKDRLKFTKAMLHPLTQTDSVRRAGVFKKVVERCKKAKECPHCGALNGLVKRVGCMRVVHEKLAKQTGQTAERARRDFELSMEQAPLGLGLGLGL